MGRTPQPGDLIEWPGAYNDEARFVENVSWIAVDLYRYEKPDLRVKDVDTPLPCGFCNPEGMVQERGVIDADYALVHAENDDVVGYTCHMCIDCAPIVDDDLRQWPDKGRPDLAHELPYHEHTLDDFVPLGR